MVFPLKDLLGTYGMSHKSAVLLSGTGQSLDGIWDGVDVSTMEVLGYL